ncbi:unnamed protein product [Brassica napus]|uniref:(rape) hypothetical protein n=1 Tax=Brassica napus TaxID=3708 RepID=A0A816S1N1_BRANA|nr:unnamed protein product [Brassica napus]
MEREVKRKTLNVMMKVMKIAKRGNVKDEASERESIYDSIVGLGHRANLDRHWLEKDKTDWHMDEYPLHRNGDEFHDLVLCHVRLLYSAERFKPHVPAHQVDVKNDNNNNDVVLPNQEQQEAGFAMLEQEAGDVNQPQQQQQDQEEQEDYILVDRHLRSNHNQRQYLLEDIFYQNGRGYVNQHQQDPLPLPPLQSNDNQERHPLDDIAFDGADDNLTIDIDELLKILDEGKEQEDSPTLPLPHPPPLQSNVNQEPCLSWDTNYVPSEVENNYNNNTILQNQEQQEDFRYYRWKVLIL